MNDIPMLFHSVKTYPFVLFTKYPKNKGLLC